MLPDTGVKSLITVMAYMQDMKGVWQMQAAAPGHELLLRIGVQHPEYGTYFQAILKAKRVVGVGDPEAFTWLMPHKVAFWIYWQVWHCLSTSLVSFNFCICCSLSGYHNLVVDFKDFLLCLDRHPKVSHSRRKDGFNVAIGDLWFRFIFELAKSICNSEPGMARMKGTLKNTASFER
jgi:hypothetical protein